MLRAVTTCILEVLYFKAAKTKTVVVYGKYVVDINLL
jgi:hypothetical protein